jgi:histone H3/H4
MTTDNIANQPTLFEPKVVDVERLLLYALGEFQSRGKILADRQLALDRLRGAFKRASEKFQTEELTDEKIAETLERLGAKVVRKPSFVAKHPFRVTVHHELSERAKTVYKETLNDD